MPKAKPLRVREIMTTKVVVFEKEMPILTAVDLLLQHRISGAPVVDKHGQVLGILTEKNCLQVLLQGAYHNLPGKTVAHYMSKNVKVVEPDIDIISMAELFINNTYRRFPVVENNKLVGLISRRDVLKIVNEII